MFLNTGYGYYVKDGKKIHKFELPKGQHPDPEGYSFIELKNKLELDVVILDKSDEELWVEKKELDKEGFKKSALSKLKSLGLSQDEINALIG